MWGCIPQKPQQRFPVGTLGWIPADRGQGQLVGQAANPHSRPQPLPPEHGNGAGVGSCRRLAFHTQVSVPLTWRGAGPGKGQRPGCGRRIAPKGSGGSRWEGRGFLHAEGTALLSWHICAIPVTGTSTLAGAHHVPGCCNEMPPGSHGLFLLTKAANSEHVNQMLAPWHSTPMPTSPTHKDLAPRAFAGLVQPHWQKRINISQ